MKKILFFLSLLLVIQFGRAQQQNFTGKTIKFQAKDDVEITADIYMAHSSDAPFIILFHQARYSRGEYREIAPKLNELGFNCIAIDQRSGKEVNGVVNQTHLEAKKRKLATQYVDAIPDLEAALTYVKQKINPDKIIIWGSSYSAALMFYLGSVHRNEVDGILAFSPGEYFKINGKELKTYAAQVNCPVFITSSGKEHKQWKGIYDAVPSQKFSFLPAEEEGKHGSKALWADNSNNQKYWKAVRVFLLKLI